MTTDIDTLMDLDPLELTKENVDSIIAYHRKLRAQQAAGGPRPKKETGPKGGVDLQALGLLSPKVDPSFKRRF